MIRSLVLNNRKVDLLNISSFVTRTEFEKSTIQFIQKWLSKTSEFKIRTSGSTGSPKAISILKSQMEASARATIAFFDLRKDDTIFLCLNTAYIAGQMMIARAMVGFLNVIAEEPSSNPQFFNSDVPINFAAFVPLQAKNVFKSKILNAKSGIKGIIIGGAAVDQELEKEIQHQNIQIYATFGMTETVSHIALRRLNGTSKTGLYETLPGVKVGIKNECLTIKGAVTNHIEIVTNDRVELVTPTSFKWLGRIDNVVNSGGVKIQIEEVERTIQLITAQLNIFNRLVCKGTRDNQLGEKLVLVIEGDLSEFDKEQLLKAITYQLPKYQAPKEIITLNKFPETKTGKINRSKILED